MNLYAALYLNKDNIKQYQDLIKKEFSEFELIEDVHLSLCHMQTDNELPDFFDCFTEIPIFQGVKWDLFEGRFSPYVYLVLVISPNQWLKNLNNKIDKKFKVEVINGDYHVSLAKIKKELYNVKRCQRCMKKMPNPKKCKVEVKSLEIRERFSTEKLMEINLVK